MLWKGSVPQAFPHFSIGSGRQIVSTTTETEIAQLQAQIAYNEKTLSDLSKVVADQGNAIDKLNAEIEVLGRQVLQLTEGEVGSH